jgi:hypothetical protein
LCELSMRFAACSLSEFSPGTLWTPASCAGKTCQARSRKRRRVTPWRHLPTFEQNQETLRQTQDKFLQSKRNWRERALPQRSRRKNACKFDAFFPFVYFVTFVVKMVFPLKTVEPKLWAGHKRRTCRYTGERKNCRALLMCR